MMAAFDIIIRMLLDILDDVRYDGGQNSISGTLIIVVKRPVGAKPREIE